MFNRILIPLDGSKLAERTIPHALRMAQMFKAKVFLLHILDPSQHQDTTNAIEPLNWQIRKAEADLYLQGISEQIREQHIEVDHTVLEGRTAESIIDFSQQEKMDLVVLCTHGASGFSRWNMSSVVSKVVEKAYISLLLIRSYQELEGDEAGSGEKVDRTAGYRRILLPIDSSLRAECALSVATSIMQIDESQDTDLKPPTLVLATVMKAPDLPIPTPYPAEINQQLQSLMRASRDAATEYLTDLQARVAGSCVPRITENTSIPAAIHALAEEEEVDLVILCAHGQTGPVAWPYGSVARNFIEHGEKHVLIVQDTHPAQVRPTAAEIAAEKYGRR